MKSYLVSLASYLTGWFIANAIWNRVYKYLRADAIQNDRDEWRTELAATIAKDLHELLSHDDRTTIAHLESRMRVAYERIDRLERGVH